MKSFIDRFTNLVKGTISGFDRIVFKGIILPLMSPAKVMEFCKNKGILNKDYKKWMMGNDSPPPPINLIRFADFFIIALAQIRLYCVYISP